eukprot:4014607-Amphidinium_carterae.1
MFTIMFIIITNRGVQVFANDEEARVWTRTELLTKAAKETATFKGNLKADRAVRNRCGPNGRLSLASRNWGARDCSNCRGQCGCMSQAAGLKKSEMTAVKPIGSANLPLKRNCIIYGS